jgi:hypothetical protein
MPRIYVLHESPEWYAPLHAALDEAGAPHEEIFLDQGVVDLTAPPPDGVYFNRLSGTAHTRGHVLAVEHARAVLRRLEGHGRRVVNSLGALELAMSKTALTAALAASGIPVPRTRSAIGLDRVVEAARAMRGPFLVKPNRSGKGVGIQAFGGVEELDRAVTAGEFGGSIDGVYVVQERIQSPDPFITRCEFVGGQLLYAVASRTGGGFNLCPTDLACDVPLLSSCDGPRFSIREGFEHPIIDAYRRFMERHAIEICAIEFIVDHAGKAFTYDLNINTNYNVEAERRAGVSGMRAIARFLARELMRQRPLRAAGAR